MRIFRRGFTFATCAAGSALVMLPLSLHERASRSNHRKQDQYRSREIAHCESLYRIRGHCGLAESQ